MFLALSITFVGVDWVMSLNPDFYSTMLGFIMMNYLGLAGLSFTIIIGTYLSRRASRWPASSSRRISPTTES